MHLLELFHNYQGEIPFHTLYVISEERPKWIVCITAYCLHHLKFFRVNIKHRRPFSPEFPYNASSDPCCTRIFLTMFCQRLESSFPCKCSTSIIHGQRQPKCTLNVIKSTALTNLTILSNS